MIPLRECSRELNWHTSKNTPNPYFLAVPVTVSDFPILKINHNFQANKLTFPCFWNFELFWFSNFEHTFKMTFFGLSFGEILPEISRDKPVKECSYGKEKYCSPWLGYLVWLLACFPIRKQQRRGCYCQLWPVFIFRSILSSLSQLSWHPFFDKFHFSKKEFTRDTTKIFEKNSAKFIPDFGRSENEKKIANMRIKEW